MRGALLLIATLALLSACSSSGTAAQITPTPSMPGTTSAAGPVRCPPALRTTFAGAARARTVAVHSDRSAGLLVCGYRDRQPARGRCSGASVSINTGPQALTDFHRWVDESVQNAGTSGLAPVLVTGIGLAADWIPAKLTFETASAQRWVAVMLTCPATGASAKALASALARTALRAT
jgi:hypothetical protein